MASTVIDFWKAHRSFWITPPSKHGEVDALITERFWGYDIGGENLVGRVIYYDQFMRHFQRAGRCSEEEVGCRRRLVITLVKERVNELRGMDEVEVMYALMPFKHLKEYDFIFTYLHGTWLVGRGPVSNYPDLHRFYMDTYKKAYTDERVAAEILQEHPVGLHYRSVWICDFYPGEYGSASWAADAAQACLSEPAFATLRGRLRGLNGPLVVSLSGGVDSMVLLALLRWTGADVCAVHVVYGNRAESEEEYMFLARYCATLDVPFYVYRIPWLRRGAVDRQFYEDMTRQLRFATYRAVGSIIGVDTSVILGHIQDDVVENIWTNIAHCQHLEDLKKMRGEEVQEGVRLVRPFLDVEKAAIYRASKALGIPYLKNTTPSWSNRGKFREHFHGATVAQYGSAIDGKVVAFAEAVAHQSRMLDALLYEPMYASFRKGEGVMGIGPALAADLDVTGWLRIFTHVCHTHYGISKPSVKCVEDFRKRLDSPWAEKYGRLQVEFGKELRIVVTANSGQTTMKFSRKTHTEHEE
jgi:tRNA(Ile)-lysidine synthetase-like protein